jgi:serine/threonine protein kinase
VSERDVPIGAVLAGKYRVERVLGQGGMGVVVEATQLDLERRVALKFLRQATMSETTVALARFEREARAVARLRGAHVVRIYDVGRLEHGEPFIVMELLHGEDLSKVLDREQRLSIATAVDYVLQSCEAMAEAHVAGVVHRDLKPANLFLTRGPDGRPLVKVLDFGISKLLAAETTSANLTNGVLGSPLYMSPEQLSSSKSIDYRTDIWSLGAILYELITGKAAFQADGLPQICTRVMLGEPEALGSEHRVPLGLQAAILGCLAKAPEARHPSVADLALALVPFARGSSHRSAEAAIRIVRGSSIPQGQLPSSFDSSPPSALPSDPVGGSALSTAEDRTINISGAPPRDVTQRELQPLVSPAAIGASTPTKAKPLFVWLAAAAVGLTLTLLLTLRGGGAGSSSFAPEPSATRGDSPAKPASSEQAGPVPRPAAEPAAIASVAAPSSAPPASATPAPQPPALPRKARPVRPHESDAEELLKHR